jgi:hypothetical protein
MFGDLYKVHCYALVYSIVRMPARIGNKRPPISSSQTAYSAITERGKNKKKVKSVSINS